MAVKGLITGRFPFLEISPSYQFVSFPRNISHQIEDGLVIGCTSVCVCVSDLVFVFLVDLLHVPVYTCLFVSVIQSLSAFFHYSLCVRFCISLIICYCLFICSSSESNTNK